MSKATQQSSNRSASRVFTRVIKESRWVHRNQLEIGMYVNELDRPWTDTSFMFQGFAIDTPEVLRQVQESCEYAHVQVEKLARVSWKGAHRRVTLVRNH